MTDDLATLHAYNRWADDRIIAAARALTAEQYTQEPAPGWASLRATLVHIAGATHAWAHRIGGETVAALKLEDELPTIDDAARVLDEAHDAFDRLASTLGPDRLAAVWSYRNLKGEEKHLPLWTVLRHVVNHASYHRGQAASKLRRLGVEPPATDFVLWAIERTAGGA